MKNKFDIDFIIIFGIFVIVIIVIGFASRVFDISFFYLFMSVAATAWLGMHFFEKIFLRELGEKTSVVYCEWENKLNLTDFSISHNTKLNLEELGYTLEAAEGEEFVFHTEISLVDPDYYFEGVIVKDNDGNYLIRSSTEIRTKRV